MPRRRSGFVTASAAALVSAVSVAVLRARLTRFRIAEQSMAPLLVPGDHVVAVRAGAPRRGVVVVFEHPARPGFELVKRVIGLPGETVEIADGRLRIDGADLLDPWARGATRPEGVWRLSSSEVFVLGDQRARSSADSRSLGPVPISRLAWRVVGRCWPPRRAGVLPPP